MSKKYVAARASIWTLVLLLAIVATSSPANAQHGQMTPVLNDYMKMVFAGDVSVAGSLFSSNPDDRGSQMLADRFERRFVARSDGLDFGRIESEAVREIGELFQSYWRDALMQMAPLDDLEDRVSDGLDSLYGARTVKVERLAKLPKDVDPAYLVSDDRNGAVYLDQSDGTVYRANLRNGKVSAIVKKGQKASGGKTIERPTQLAVADYVIVVDDKGRPFRWSPSNSAGAGTLAKITLRGRSSFGDDHGDIEAYDPPVGNYRIYVAEPSLNQVMKYTQNFDGSSFAEPVTWLSSPSNEVADIDQIYIDFDMYTLFDDTLRRFVAGKWDGRFALDELPDDGDLRPGHRYTMVDGSGSDSSLGRAYLYDAEHGRIVGFDKLDGSYIGQWYPRDDGQQMADIRGMYVIEGGLNKKRTKRKNDQLVWVTPDGIYKTTLNAG